MLWSHYVFGLQQINTILLSNCNVMVENFGALCIFLNEYHIYVHCHQSGRYGTGGD